jgi:hypothetical protein
MGFPSEFVVQFSCVFAMFLIWFFSLVPIRRAQSIHEEGYDNSNPRDQYTKLVCIFLFSFSNLPEYC